MDEDASSYICKVLREIIIPSLEEHGVSRVVLAKTHFEKGDLPASVQFTNRELQGQPLRRRNHISRHAAYWPDQSMQKWRFPLLCFVFGGEADLPVGDAILHCPAGHAVLVPAGVPMGDGATPHWCRPHPENASSDIFWLNIRTFGAEIYICHTRGEQHDSGWAKKRFAIPNPQLFSLLEGCIAEMEQPRSLATTAAASYLLLLFCLLQRHWDSDITPTAHSAPPDDPAQREMDDPSVVIRRAKQYIDVNLRESLSLETIACAAYVSRSHLAQVFRNELQQTVWEYVSEQRLEKAKLMLSDTDLCIAEVARLSGLSRTSHFYARFATLTGVSPGQFRRDARSDTPREKLATKSNSHGR